MSFRGKVEQTCLLDPPKVLIEKLETMNLCQFFNIQMQHNKSLVTSRRTDYDSFSTPEAAAV